MNKIILAKYVWYKQVEKFFLDNALAWDDYLGLKEEIQAFFDFLEQFEATKAMSEGDTKGVTESKNNTFDSLRILSMDMAGKAKVWAKKTKNTIAISHFDVVKGDFSINHSKSVDLASKIHKTAKDNKAELVKYRVTDATLLALENLIKKATEEIGTPGAEKDKISTSLHGLKPLTVSIDDALENIANLMSDYRDTNTTLFEGFVTVNKMDDPRARYTKVMGKVNLANGTECANYLVKIKELINEQDITDQHGDYEILEFKGGEYTLQVLNEKGELVKEIPFKVLTGKKVGVNVVV